MKKPMEQILSELKTDQMMHQMSTVAAFKWGFGKEKMDLSALYPSILRYFRSWTEWGMLFIFQGHWGVSP